MCCEMTKQTLDRSVKRVQFGLYCGWLVISPDVVVYMTSFQSTLACSCCMQPSRSIYLFLDWIFTLVKLNG